MRWFFLLEMPVTRRLRQEDKVFETRLGKVSNTLSQKQNANKSSESVGQGIEPMTSFKIKWLLFAVW
jgi:hypothetical protein